MWHTVELPCTRNLRFYLKCNSINQCISQVTHHVFFLTYTISNLHENFQHPSLLFMGTLTLDGRLVAMLFKELFLLFQVLPHWESLYNISLNKHCITALGRVNLTDVNAFFMTINKSEVHMIPVTIIQIITDIEIWRGWGQLKSLALPCVNVCKCM